VRLIRLGAMVSPLSTKVDHHTDCGTQRVNSLPVHPFPKFVAGQPDFQAIMRHTEFSLTPIHAT